VLASADAARALADPAPATGAQAAALLLIRSPTASFPATEALAADFAPTTSSYCSCSCSEDTSFCAYSFDELQLLMVQELTTPSAKHNMTASDKSAVECCFESEYEHCGNPAFVTCDPFSDLVRLLYLVPRSDAVALLVQRCGELCLLFMTSCSIVL
jgi:hypothetical protein